MIPKSPINIEEMLSAIYLLQVDFPKLENIPYERSLVLSHSFLRDLCERLLVIENTTKGSFK